MSRLPLLFGASLLALAPAPSRAQTTPTPADPLPSIPPPTPTPTPEPSSTPTATPTPDAVPSPTPTPTARPTPRATPKPKVTPTPTPTPEPTASATREPTASATPTPTPSPAATPAPIETVVLPKTARPAIWPWVAGAALLLGLAALALRRRREEPVPAEPIADEPAPSPSPPPRARLAIDFRPTRAGLNLVTATVEGEATVANIGDAPARDIRVAVGLQGATADAARRLADFAAQPVVRPATPPFTLGPGEERRFRAVAALPLDAIPPLHAAGRPMFVPLVAISARWTDDGGERGAAQAFAVGVERVDSAKLAPLWLDVAPRAYENVAARPYEGMLER